MSLPFGEFDSVRGRSQQISDARLTFVPLPSVGSRYDYLTSGGERIGVLVDDEGRRSLVIGSRDDPDTARTIPLDEEDRLVLLGLLGSPGGAAGSLDLLTALASVQNRVAGLVVCSVGIEERSPLVGGSIEEALPSGLEVSVVAVRRDGRTETANRATHPSPGDTIVVVGSPRGVRKFLDLCEPLIDG